MRCIHDQHHTHRVRIVKGYRQQNAGVSKTQQPAPIKESVNDPRPTRTARKPPNRPRGSRCRRRRRVARWHVLARSQPRSRRVAPQSRPGALEQTRQREIEARWQSTVDQQASELSNARTTITQQASRLRALSLDSSRLRDQLTAYAAGSPGEDSVAACHARAAALSAYAADLGAVAGEIAIAARQSAVERDEFAAEVNALIKAWPRAGER